MGYGTDGLGAAVIKKWNATSVKVGAPLYIDAEDWHYAKGVGESNYDQFGSGR